MQPSSSNLVDLCLADVLQDVTGDNLSAQEASDAWRRADKDASFSSQQATPATTADTAYEQANWDVDSEHTRQAEQDMTEEPDAQQEAPDNDDSMQDVSDSPAEPEETAQEWTEQEPSGQEESPELQQQQSATQVEFSSLPEDIAEQLPGPPDVKQTSRQEQQDRSAATLSKELRKLQAETTVLQAHSKRLQEKAATIQQQRAADQAKQEERLSQDYLQQLSFKSGDYMQSTSSNAEGFSNSTSEGFSNSTSLQASQMQARRGQSQGDSQLGSGEQAERPAGHEPWHQRQGSSSAGNDGQPAYLYSSVATAPSQDGALQWSIGGVPLQQQLRLLSADNGMEASEAAAQQEPSQGLQWGSTLQNRPGTLKKKRCVAVAKQPKDSQVGKINSIAAMHDAQSKQMLNPLKMRKAPQGDAANPVIRQRSVAQQAKHKQRFADTLRGDSDAEPATLANEQSMSLSGLQQQPEDQAEHIGAHYHAQLTPYGSALTSSKSEPHGLYSKSAQLYAAQLASSGLPKSNSVHDLDMGDMQPVAAKRRGRAAARRNLPSAPEGYTQGWGQAQTGYPTTMPGMQGSMYSQQGMPLLPQLGPARMGGTQMGMSYMSAPQALQQPFGPPQGLQGPHATNTRRGPGRQAGSALPFSGIGNAQDPFSNYAMQQQQQQQQQQQAGMMQNWGSPFAAAQQPFPAQYAQNAASMGQAMPNGFAGYSPASSGGYPGVSSTGMLPRRAKNKGNVFGQPSMQQSYAAGPMAAAMPPVGYPSQPMPFAGGMTQMGGVPQQMGAPMPWGSGAAMQQRADGMQQYQLQQHLQMQNNIMQHLQQNQNHALLKYGNFDAATYKQSDLKSRPEFRTY